MGKVTASLASCNPNKLRELARALPGWELSLLDAEDYPAEADESYHANARAKARFGREVGEPGAWMLGEDSGLEVDGLSGGPGPLTARFAGPGEDPVAKLLEVLRGVEGAGRRARYVCELVSLSPEGEELHGRGVLAGRIASERRGSGGFGFDPVFVPDGELRTMAELGDEWKARNSHRARAARALLEVFADAAAQ